MCSSQPNTSPLLSCSLILLFFLISKSQIMKKTYLIPAMKAEEAQAVSMLAESLAIDSTTKVDGGDALARGDNNWDIWGE